MKMREKNLVGMKEKARKKFDENVKVELSESC